MKKDHKKRTVVLLCLLLALAACGNKGDLYLPDKTITQVETVALPI